MIRTFIHHLTSDRSTTELCFQFSFTSLSVGPVRLELTTPGVKDRYSDPIELRTNFVAATGFEPASETYETSGVPLL